MSKVDNQRLDDLKEERRQFLQDATLNIRAAIVTQRQIRDSVSDSKLWDRDSTEEMGRLLAILDSLGEIG